MATSTKLSFRARALDSNKAMCVYYASELPDLSDCTPIARAVAQMPTGMEKEEEMESHLQDAIIAQQASTSGIRVDNHVIPTPKVFEISNKRYDEIYPPQPSPPKNHYIKVQEPDYDVDSEDEKWLCERPHIEARTLERIFDTLEAQSSDNNICLPATARSVLTAFDEGVVDDVYDYWLAKREKSAATRSFQLGVGGLIPRVRTECRKDSQGAINPYVAFRRRAEKMQTRKNRKNDEDSYEKVLKLSHDLRKTVTLFDMVKRREKTKLALIDLDSDILAHRMGLADFGSVIFNQFMAKLRSDKPLTTINGISKMEGEEVPKKRSKKFSRKIRPSLASMDREVPNKAWLKKNAEVWNRPPTVFCPNGVSPVVEVERCAQAASDANLDGRYTFKRRRGCCYRAPLIPKTDAPSLPKISSRRHFVNVALPSANGVMRSPVLARKRVGRGGRIIYDRLIALEPRVPKVYDPFEEEYTEDLSLNFQSKIHPWSNESRPLVERWPREEDDYLMEEKWISGNEQSSTVPSCEKIETTPKDNSGNGLSGRVDHPPTVPTKACGETTDDWREGSGSPSESNSSAEWTTPPSLGARLTDFAFTSGEEDARTGEHPVALQPPVKESMMGVGATMMECTPYILAPPSVGS
ncbi:unnamed protein product [Auanema sp. JU1783]|nr:unnamed protein product [Auanema sp. JU1783]